MNTLLATHSFTFNPNDNGGESLSIETKIYDNGDAKHGLKSGIFLNQTINLQSYGNSAQFNLCGATLTPDLLRRLANELDSLIAKRSS